MRQKPARLPETVAVLTRTSPIGPLAIKATPKGLASIEFLTGRPKEQRSIGRIKTQIQDPATKQALQHLELADRQLTEFFNGNRHDFELEFDLKGTSFQKRVWKALTRIPYGKTTSYVEIARQVGCPKGPRAVGMANNRNPLPIVIPCHRVIGKNGTLVGYGGGLKVKEFLLHIERK